ncbi:MULTISPECIES: SigE family RNA polymerase sigma factor [unclassified Isoptericola]|uniref:SigE family RNA polymerase sigma factor n=1 Tax=unclassified Isoptericola TaxID=2623355 RepID=UPI0027134D15|nr:MULTISPECIES: SigE family RNA polymerase sigma factor [unclassified Isoptericola]MDO8143657.1 SigE family RNA polymerase sigma factor [Isoptericola sp. 178]MDO8147553.1 SigE family RNA polymerase sigma factor [Isoptericola sp. b515]MDO8150145.1 SigE family RNA polymerase sigma factor [Isoptericola sp. b408]
MGEMIQVPIASPGTTDTVRAPSTAVHEEATPTTAVAEFTAFARARTAGLYRIAFLLCGDEHRAHDLVQTALERTYRAWPRISSDPFAYARRVVATSRIDTWRRTRREVLRDPAPGTSDLGASEHAPDHARHVAERDRLVRALQMLPETQRRVVVLRHLLDRSEQQTADELNLARGTVKSAGSRGLAALRAVLTTTTEEDA